MQFLNNYLLHKNIISVEVYLDAQFKNSLIVF